MMPELISSSTRRAILGLGTTGRSVARFWKARGIPFIALDTRAELANDLDLRRELVGIEAHFGEVDDAVFRCDRLADRLARYCHGFSCAFKGSAGRC